MIFPYDPTFLISRTQSDSNMPAPRDAAPILCNGTAIAHERALALADPFKARDWDLLADRRRDRWLRCPFAAAFDELFVSR